MKALTKETFQPSTDMIHAAQAVFVCMAAVETIRPIVTGYQRAILERMQPHIAPDKQDRRVLGDTLIVNPDHSYLMDDADFQFYLAECRKEQAKAGLKTDNPEFCPLLVAENNLTKAKHLLIDAMQPLTGVRHEQLFRHGLDDYNKYIDLTLRLLAPFVKNPFGKAA